MSQLTVKGVTCRICNRGLKKAGVHCQLCGLHCHTGCASLDSPRCDVMEPFGLPARRRDVFQSAKARIEDDTSITPPPQNKLSGWKRRTKSALMSHPSSSVDLFARRSSIDLRHPGTAYDLHRGSMDTNPSSVHSQGSMYSGASGSEGNGRRQSAIRFELGQEEQGVEKMLRDEAGGKGRPPSRLGKGHRRGMESKSDCVIM